MGAHAGRELEYSYKAGMYALEAGFAERLDSPAVAPVAETGNSDGAPLKKEVLPAEKPQPKKAQGRRKTTKKRGSHRNWPR